MKHLPILPHFYTTIIKIIFVDHVGRGRLEMTVVYFHS